MNLLLGILLTISGVKLTPYLAEDTTSALHAAVVVCPGGSYSWLDMKTEGIPVAKWLAEEGIHAFVLKYRVASIGAYITGFRVLGIGHKYPDMERDAEAALQYLYEHAEEYHIDTTRIGIMGFSAGGHLAISSYVYNKTPYKPHFIAAIYPVVSMSREVSHVRSRRGALGVWGQFNKQMRDSLSLEKHITGDCPPVFLMNCMDDPVVRYENSVLLDSALTAEEVEHVYIQYEKGGHGFGTGLQNENVSVSDNDDDNYKHWTKRFTEWISNLNL